jgi:hypothetical protein
MPADKPVRVRVAGPRAAQARTRTGQPAVSVTARAGPAVEVRPPASQVAASVAAPRVPPVQVTLPGEAIPGPPGPPGQASRIFFAAYGPPDTTCGEWDFWLDYSTWDWWACGPAAAPALWGAGRPAPVTLMTGGRHGDPAR